MAARRRLVTITNISQYGNHLARLVRKNLAWSRQLSKDVVLSKAKEEGEVVSITLSIGDKKKDKSGNPLSGMARAYEYGSGEKATRGEKKRYPITPKTKKALWFYMDNPNENLLLYEKDGIIGVTLPKVMHPGVEARPFLSPAIQELLPRLSEQLRLDITRNLVDTLKAEIKGLK